MVNKTPKAMLTADIELTPEKVEYVGADAVRVTMKTETGDAVSYTMKTASLVKSVNLSVNLINNCTAQVFRDLGVF
jgi:hypothetical protein